MGNWFLETAAAYTFSLGGAEELQNAETANSAIAALFNRIAEILLVVAIPLALVGIIFAAISLIQAAGNPEGYKQVKKTIMMILTGFVFIALAAVIVRFLVSLFQ